MIRSNIQGRSWLSIDSPIQTYYGMGTRFLGGKSLDPSLTAQYKPVRNAAQLNPSRHVTRSGIGLLARHAPNRSWTLAQHLLRIAFSSFVVLGRLRQTASPFNACCSQLSPHMPPLREPLDPPFLEPSGNSPKGSLKVKGLLIPYP